DVVGDAKLVRYPARIFHRRQAAAAALGKLAIRQIRRPQLHRNADDVVAFLFEQRRRHGAVHPAAHGDHDANFMLRRRTGRQRPPRRRAVRSLHGSHSFLRQIRTAAGARPRSLATLSATASTTAATSSIVVYLPTVTRKAPSVSSLGKPTARSTWAGSSEPEVQAEPAEAAMPAKSRLSSSDSPSTPGKLKWALLGSRCVGCPFSTASGTRRRMPSISASRSRAACSAASILLAAARRSAALRPTMPATCSVPARKPLSWPPPCSSGSTRRPRRT